MLEQRYQFHVAGEGGEYETLTLDCPIFKVRHQAMRPSGCMPPLHLDAQVMINVEWLKAIEIYGSEEKLCYA